ncbi:MAG: ATP-binding protein [Acidobacteriota bacterium]
MKETGILRYRKDPRFIISVPLLIFAATSLIYYLVQRAKELSPEALSSRLLLFVLWNINLILILGILFVLFRGVVKLLLDRQRGILGSRFRTKLVATYVVTSLLPIVVLFFVATDLLRVSIDRWFNTPVRELLQNSEAIAESAQNRAAVDAERAAAEIADGIERGGMEALDRTLAHARRFHNIELAGVYQSGMIMKLDTDPRAPIHEVSEPPASFFSEVHEKGQARRIDVGASGKWIRSAVEVRRSDAVALTAVSGVFLPSTVSRMIDENIIAQKNFEQLDSQRPALKTSQTLLFLTVTLSILFGVLWTSMYVSRRITVPIQALAEGTTTLASGHYEHRINVRATDEFGVLIDSFNRMASQLDTQRSALTASNDETQQINRRLDDERAYLATVLDSVSTGILAFTGQFGLLSINGAALRMLQLEQPPFLAQLDAVFPPGLDDLRQFIYGLRDESSRPREITILLDGELRYLDVSVAPLKGRKGPPGWVMAIEDLTQLVQAQKLAAWSEAARRIAHEIKNPLTPIQLSAERIAKKFRNGDPDLESAVYEGCETIVSEVGQLKRMVDEFSRFARLPAIHLRQIAIAEVFDEAARLYREIKPGVVVQIECDPTLQAVIDPEQIRRALVNLLDNALEATDAGEIRLVAASRPRRVVISVIDPGRGIPDRDKENLFLPYFSTKKEGTGLGLAIVYRIVQDHDGRITVHDNHPRGTRFDIELPA